MSDGTSGSAKLSDSFPQPSVLTGLVGQLKDGMGGVKAPGMPEDKIQSLSAGFQLPIPDSSTWHTAIPDDAKNLTNNFPDPAALAKPIMDPIGKVQDFFSFDFGKFQQNQVPAASSAPAGAGAAAGSAPSATAANGTNGAAAAAPDVLSFLDSLSAPIDDATRMLADPELARILQALGSLTGEPAFEQVPGKVQDTAGEMKTVLHDNIEGIILGLVTLASAHSVQETIGMRVGAATGSFSPAHTQARLQAVLDQFGGPTPLAAMVASADPSDAAATSALQDRLNAANQAFQTYTGRLVLDFALTEAALSLLDVSDFQSQWEQIQASVSKVDWTAAGALAGQIAGEFQKMKDKLTVSPGYTFDQYKQAIQTGVAALDQTIGKFDPSTVVAAIQKWVKLILSPLEKLEDFKKQVETIVRGALGTIRDAIEKIDIKPLMDSVKQAIAALGDSIRKVAALLSDVRNAIESALTTVKQALDGVKTFVLDPQHGLKKQIEDVFHGVESVLDALKIQEVTGEIKALLKPIDDALGKIEFKPVIDAVMQAIDTITGILNKVAPLLVSDSLKQKLAEAGQSLQQIDFGKIGTDLQAEFGDILASVNQDALGEFQAEYEQVVATIKNLDPEPALQEAQKDVFDPLLAELQQVHPADLLKPVNDAFTAAHGALSKFDPTNTFSFLSDFFQGLLAQIESISPEKLLAPIEATLDQLRQQIDALLHIDAIVAAFEKFQGWVKPAARGLDLFGPVLEGLAEGHGQMRNAIANFDGTVFTKVIANALDGVFSRLGASINVAGFSAAISAISEGPGDANRRLAAMQQSLAGASTALAAVDVQSALTNLSASYAAVNAALQARTGAPLPGSVTASIGSLDPMPVLAPILPKIDRVKAAAATAASDFNQMVAPFEAVLQSLNGPLNLLHALLSPLTMLRDIMIAPLAALFPGQHFAGPQDVLVYFLDQLSPAELIPVLQPFFTTVESKLKSLVDDAVLNPVGEAVRTLQGATDLLNIHSLVDAITGVFHDVEGVIQSLDPTPLIQDIVADYRRIVTLLDQANPAQFIAEISKIYEDDIIGVIRNISPEALLLPPLRELFQKISSALGAFDIQAMFKPVLDKLQSLDGDLGGGLQQVEASWQKMLAALASASGGSASVSVSAQAA